MDQEADKKTRIEAVRREAKELIVGLERFDKLVEEYITATGISQTGFGYEATGYVDFVRLLRGGRDHRVSTIKGVLEFMAAGHRPRAPGVGEMLGARA
jgi:hypothetical protein